MVTGSGHSRFRLIRVGIGIGVSISISISVSDSGRGGRRRELLSDFEKAFAPMIIDPEIFKPRSERQGAQGVHAGLILHIGILTALEYVEVAVGDLVDAEKCLLQSMAFLGTPHRAEKNQDATDMEQH